MSDDYAKILSYIERYEPARERKFNMTIMDMLALLSIEPCLALEEAFRYGRAKGYQQALEEAKKAH